MCVSQQPQLLGLELADWADQTSQLEVDILLGADQYWNVVTGAVSHIPEGGPTAVHTKLGWVLSGPIPWTSKAGPRKHELWLLSLLMSSG